MFDYKFWYPILFVISIGLFYLAYAQSSIDALFAGIIYLMATWYSYLSANNSN